MEIHPSGSRPPRRPPADWFAGPVWQDPILDTPEPAHVRSSVVRFDPGARTNWHTHPLGQTLYVLAGRGLIQREGQPARIIRPGDVVWIPPDEKHWHGAAWPRAGAPRDAHGAESLPRQPARAGF